MTDVTDADEATSAGQGGESGEARHHRRRQEGRRLRRESMERAFGDPLPGHPTNGEEGENDEHPYFANHAKGLPHNDLGEVDPAAYRAMVHAFRSGRPEDFERIPMGMPDARKQLNPQGGLAFNLQGPDPFSTVVRPAPRLDSAQNSAEMAELYWLALLRDVKFGEFETSPLVAEAAADMSTYSDFRGPKQGGRVTPATLFRGDTRGDLTGPFVSQFLLQDVQYGTTRIPHRHDTVLAGRDFGTAFDDYVALQRGAPRQTERDFANTRYLQTPRDLAHYTHFDLLYQPYLYAALIMLAMREYPAGLQDKGNPYRSSRNQVGFCAFGSQHLVTLLSDVANLAIKHTLFQQFHVHRRIRPEVLGGRLHVQLERSPGRYEGLIDREILESAVLDRIRSSHGSYLLPQAFPEGSPMSPAYHAGHCSVAGAGVTILKAWFDESFVLPRPVVPSEDGTRLVPYDGPPLTVGGELNKLAANIGAGRSAGGVHWRSDNTEGYRVGEAIALAMLRDQKDNHNEDDATFTVTTFDGETVTI